MRKNKLKMINVVKAVIKKDDKYLLLLRSEKVDVFPYHWDFPGGKIDLGESPKEAIIREVFEETNLEIEPIEIIDEIEIEAIVKGKKSLVNFKIFSVKINFYEIKLSDEHLECKWMTEKEFMKIKVTPFLRKMFFKE